MLCGYDDDTIGGTRAVKRGGCGVFQHRYRLDVIGVERVHDVVGAVGIIGHLADIAAHHGHTVDNIERRAAGVHGADTSNLQAGC